jgi:hypothetical protein
VGGKAGWSSAAIASSGRKLARSPLDWMGDEALASWDGEDIEIGCGMLKCIKMVSRPGNYATIGGDAEAALGAEGIRLRSTPRHGSRLQPETSGRG